MTQNEYEINRDFKGIWIPREIWLAEGLTSMEKVLWAEIDSLYSEEDNGCFASNEYLAKFMGVKERTIRDALCKFRQLNLIEDISFNGRDRVIKAVIPEEFCLRQPAWRKSATLRGENPPSSMADFRTPHIYRDTTRVTTLDNTPLISPQKKRKPEKTEKQEAAKAESTGVDSVEVCDSKKKKSKGIKEFSPIVREVSDKMVEILVKCNPVYRPPDKMEKFLEQVEIMVEKEKQDVDLLLKTFEWGCSDNVKRDSFSGWQSILITNKKGGKSTNPPQIFREYYSKIHAQMGSRAVRKFAPCSDDAKVAEMMKNVRNI